MTLVTFANVVARYVFNTEHPLGPGDHGLPLRLAGAARCLLLRQDPRPSGRRRQSSTWSGPAPAASWPLSPFAACLAFSVLLLVGSWNYWSPFAALPMLDGTLKDQAWYEVNDIPMLGFLRFIEEPR